MNPTEFTLLEQLKITDREIRRRLAFLDIEDDESQLISGYKAMISQEIDLIVDEFYQAMIRFDETTRIIGDADTLTRLKNYQKQYILDLFGGDYGADYVRSRLRIGLVHKRIGVTPKLYIMAFRILMDLLRNRIMTDSKAECQTCSRGITALEKIMLFDLTLVFDTYIHGLLDELAKGRKELEEYAEGLEETIAKRTEELREMARMDGLTDLLNQRSFYEELKREHSRARRNNEAFSLIYFDLDGFKAVNDTQGHTVGDEILVRVAEVIRQTIRYEDISARYGGDEFCIILPNTPLKDAQAIANRMVETFKKKMRDTGTSLSIGISTFDPKVGTDTKTLVKKADAAMYQSKNTSGCAITLADG